jgi:uncharacterized protein DUF4389
MAYPVSYSIERPESYNRLTVFFRLILAIPHYIILFGFPFVIFMGAFDSDSPARGVLQLLNYVSLNTVIGILVFLAWFAIIFAARFPEKFLGVCLKIFKWEQNVIAYMLLLTDKYPPFGPEPYELNLEIISPEKRNRLTTFFRIILVIPHAVVLAFLNIALQVVTFIAWFAILFTGHYPASMYDFSLGVARWAARVAAYMYLLVDEYPPFSLSAEAGGAAGLQPQPQTA